MSQLPTCFVDSRDFARIAAAIRFIDENFRAQPGIEDIAAQVGLSEFHFSRLFRRWAGLSPKQYLSAVTGRAARDELAAQASVLDAAYAVGLSGSSRLHDLMVTLEAMTPGELKSQGAGTVIRFGYSDTPFGTAMIAATPRGLCHLSFTEQQDEPDALSMLRRTNRLARLQRDDDQARRVATRIWTAGARRAKPLQLAVAGTNFQVKVWQALLDLAPGGRTTYGAIAAALGAQTAVRAVGNAVGANPIAWLIPCHRVLRAGGALGGYRWGADRKRALLAWESMGEEVSVQARRGERPAMAR